MIFYMEGSNFDVDVSRIRHEHNERVFSGSLGGRADLVMDKDGEDLNFNQLFENPIFIKLFDDLLSKYANYLKEHPDDTVKGFTIFGSWINGAPSPKSDLDAAFLVKNKISVDDHNDFVKRFQSRDVHILRHEYSAKKIDREIEALIRGKKSLGTFSEIQILLGGLPFGKELQDMQKRVMAKVWAITPESLRTTVWEKISKRLHDAETGDTGKGIERKYAMWRARSLTLEEYSQRLQKREVWTNNFCSQNGIPI